MMEAPVEYLTEWPPPLSPPVERNGELERQKRRCFSLKEENQPLKKTKRDREPPLSTDERELAERSPAVPVSTLLAQWCKSTVKQKHSSRETDPPISSHNPHTLLYHISKRPEAKEFLSARIHYLETQPESAQSLHSLASTHYLLQHYQTALNYSKRAVEREPDNQELLWQLELVQRQNNVLQKQQTEMSKLDSIHGDLVIPKPTEVERREARGLSYREFLTQYALTHTPVVITGAVDKMLTQQWTFNYIKKMIGEKVAPLKRVVPGSVEWARLEPAGSCIVSEFIDTIFNQTSADSELKYLFDWSLPLHCPELAQQLTIPRYFSGDFLQRSPPGSLYRDSWPSLFVSPANITSDLHVDTFGSNFWMALFQGRKRWTFFPPEDLPLLYPIYHDSTDVVFEVNLSKPDLVHHPLLSLSHPLTTTLSPGELLFVPAGSPHRVENLEPSLAISANYVDPSNLEQVMKELKINALQDPRAQSLLETLEEADLGRSVDYEQEDLSWDQFKIWPK